MFDNDEKLLQEVKEQYNNATASDNIEDYIRRGIMQGKRARKNTLKKRFIGIAAMLVFVVFSISAFTSSVLAGYLMELPGFEYIYNLIGYDKGLKAAIENEYLQPVRESQTKGGINFTVENIIADESRIIVLYSIKNYSGKRIGSYYADFKDEKGKDVEAGIGSNDFFPLIYENKKQVEGMFDLSFNDSKKVPNELKLSLWLYEKEPGDEEKGTVQEEGTRQKRGMLLGSWNMSIPIDKEKIKKMKQVYDLNKEVIVEKQKIMFKKIVVYPTRIKINLEFDRSNSKKLFGFDDLRVVDENGEEWAGIKNGVSGSYKSDNERILYLESNYFKNPKELYLVGSSIRALDKNKLKVKVDLENYKLLEAPDDKLQFLGIGDFGTDELSNSGNSLKFILKRYDAYDRKHSYDIFSYKFADATGREYEINQSGFGTDDTKGIMHIDLFNSEIESLASPITFTLVEYPSRIKGNFKIRIK